jgi:hypothetical protein
LRKGAATVSTDPGSMVLGHTGVTTVLEDGATRAVVVHLTPVGSSPAAGTAFLALRGDRLLVVRLVISGLVADSRHPVHIHFGTCAGGGPIAYPLNDLVAGLDGIARSVTEVPGIQVIPPHGWFINVHTGPTMQDGGAVPISCGDVSLVEPVFAPGATRITGPVTVVLAMQDGSSANGTAELAFVAPDELSVSLRLNSLPPNTVHPAHIHFGTCAGGGPIAFFLPDVVADAEGNGVSETTLQGIDVIPPEGWSINVHQGPTLADGGITPIACGDVTPGAPVVP